ncbi:hypothetical protein KP509_30G027100 [Ceratopteris richardii]|uniref:Uncharacterized protein n=1 Tax=Ceratopteris richardii TaxID=49495 RepID=A0A8T2R128_CERRI|nr:hypothetical protein KP509_30G027100 [Ceratopteris richardii]
MEVCLDSSPLNLLDGHEATSSCFSEDGRWLAVSHTSGIIQIYRVADGGLSFTLKKQSSQKYPCLSMCFRPTEGLFSTKNVLISVDVGGCIHHWHASSGKLISTIQEPGNEIFSVAHQDTGVLFATAGLDTKVRIYDGLTRKMSLVLDEGDGSSTTGHTNRIFALKWNLNDTDVIMSGGWDKTLQVWDLRIGKSVRSIYGPFLCGSSLDFDMNNERILTGSWRTSEQLQEWDYGTGALIRTILWPQGMDYDKLCKIYSACYGRGMAQELIAAGGNIPNQVSLFHWESGQLVGGLQQLEKGVVCVSFNNAGTHMSVVSPDQVYIVEFQEAK